MKENSFWEKKNEFVKCEKPEMAEARHVPLPHPPPWSCHMLPWKQVSTSLSKSLTLQLITWNKTWPGTTQFVHPLSLSSPGSHLNSIRHNGLISIQSLHVNKTTLTAPYTMRRWGSIRCFVRVAKKANSEAKKASSKKSKHKNSTKVSMSMDTISAAIEEIYQKKTPVEHILLRPDTYVGSLVASTQSQWVYNQAKRRIVQKECKYVPGLYKIFDEILVNAADHKQRDPLGMTEIRVEIDEKNGLISVFNDGAGIPVQIHKTEGVYLPELLLGHLLTGSNFNDDVAKVTGGRNGYGAKLANIFSVEFSIETYDEKTGLFYAQRWDDHMSKCNAPTITSTRPKGKIYGNGNGGFTQVTFKPDLSIFHMRNLTGDDILPLMKRRVHDIAACLPDVKVFLNSERILSNFKHEYSASPEQDLLVVQVNDRWTVGIGANPEPSQLTQLSFVNCVHTLHGGTHVNYIADQVIKYALDKIKRKTKSTVTPAQIRNHLFVVVKCLIENPVFDSQTKERLVTKADKFGSECVLEEKHLKEMLAKSDLVNYVVDQVERSQKKALARASSASKKSKLVGVPKLDDANLAGGPKSKNCVLIITEGDSAKTLAVSGLSVVGRDYYGVYPVQGKLLNVRDVATQKVSDNKEITDLIQAIGLNLHRNYSNWETDSETLRYGKVMLMADQDPDGSHIKGLFINFIHHYWPNLLKNDQFLLEFVTPLIKATKKSTNGRIEATQSFYSIAEYDHWKTSTEDLKNWNIKYYKGLGTSTSAEAKQYFSELKHHVVKFKWVSEADKLIDMVFNRKFASDRRTWLESYDPQSFADTSKGVLDYDSFINKELIAFSHYDNLRSIPSVIDGLKPSQRKVLYSAFKRKLHQEIKVVQLAGYVSEQAGYHHGEQSLHGTIIHMAQDFIGSNNVPLFVPSGQFGTRLQGGKDAASPRYIFTYLSKLTRLIFPEYDDCNMAYLDDDGFPIEPRYYVPIIPLLLVNGAEGVGTGWSTSVPCFNPMEVIANVRALINGQPMTEMHPFYRGFTGDIYPHLDSYVSKGRFTRVGKDKIRITELPIGRWTADYKQFLDNLAKEKSIVKEFAEYHTDELVSFLITLMDPEVLTLSDDQIIDTLKLKDSIRISNMCAFDADGSLKKYASPSEIIQDFYPVRLEFYQKRKDFMIKQLTNVVTKLNNQRRFIELVAFGKLDLMNKKKQQVISELDNLKFDKFDGAEPSSYAGSYSYLLSTPIFNLTAENIASIVADTISKQSELEALSKTTPSDMWRTDLDTLETALKANAFTNASGVTIVPPRPASKPLKLRTKAKVSIKTPSSFSAHDVNTNSTVTSDSHSLDNSNAILPPPGAPVQSVKFSTKTFHKRIVPNTNVTISSSTNPVGYVRSHPRKKKIIKRVIGNKVIYDATIPESK